MATDDERNQSGVGISGSRPIGKNYINPARKAGGPSLRDGMRGYDVPLRDRVKARNMDARMARQGDSQGAPVAIPSSTTPASGQLLDQRRNLFAQMEKVGPAGISPEMRNQARGLGVDDAAFNAASGRISQNSQFSPAVQPVPVAGPPQAPQPTVPSAPPPAASTRASTPPQSDQPAAPVNPRVNRLTGQTFGNSGYTPLWRKGAPYRPPM